ncbi:MAG: hypothetical protein L0922_01345, partial [Candidatus Mariimomonas ferrooxydans]
TKIEMSCFMLLPQRSCHSDLFGIILCTPVFFVKTKKGYLTIPEASLRVESLRPDKPCTIRCMGEQEGCWTSQHDRHE